MKQSKGFTLIELLIAVAIVGIISAVAYPSYQSSIIASRRADAKAALVGFAQAMERYYTNNGTYTGAAESDADSGSPTIYSTTSPLDGSDIYYNLTIDSSTDSAYLLKADPVNSQDGDGMLTISSTGLKGWDEDDDGTISSSEEEW
ncbi:type IV pilin protein [Psychromonas sp. PT13]|uniref:type IV pilin protein n=1 Tax=Psychromonas sp. PT13 TaxID=3439547 RepID=UPI003EBD47C7